MRDDGRDAGHRAFIGARIWWPTAVVRKGGSYREEGSRGDTPCQSDSIIIMPHFFNMNTWVSHGVCCFLWFITELRFCGVPSRRFALMPANKKVLAASAAIVGAGLLGCGAVVGRYHQQQTALEEFMIVPSNPMLFSHPGGSRVVEYCSCPPC